MSSEARDLRRVVLPELSRPSSKIRISWSGWLLSLRKSDNRPILTWARMTEVSLRKRRWRRRRRRLFNLYILYHNGRWGASRRRSCYRFVMSQFLPLAAKVFSFCIRFLISINDRDCVSLTKRRSTRISHKTGCRIASNLLFMQIRTYWNPVNYKYWEWGKILHFGKNETFPQSFLMDLIFFIFWFIHFLFKFIILRKGGHPYFIVIQNMFTK